MILTLNALVIISTLYTSDGILANGYSGEVTEIVNQANLSQLAFATVLDSGSYDGFASQIVAVCLLFFSFSTILSWHSFGRINITYLFGEKVSGIYIKIALVFIFIGTLFSSNFVWEMTDMFNNLMVLPNVIALFALTNLVVDSIPVSKVDSEKDESHNDD